MYPTSHVVENVCSEGRLRNLTIPPNPVKKRRSDRRYHRSDFEALQSACEAVRYDSGTALRSFVAGNPSSNSVRGGNSSIEGRVKEEQARGLLHGSRLRLQLSLVFTPSRLQENELQPAGTSFRLSPAAAAAGTTRESDFRRSRGRFQTSAHLLIHFRLRACEASSSSICLSWWPSSSIRHLKQHSACTWLQVF